MIFHNQFLPDFVNSYNVIDTNYTSYSMIYACDDVRGNMTQETAIILSRTPSLPEETINSLLDKLVEELDYDRDIMVYAGQTNCD